jgi:hypothetical protein
MVLQALRSLRRTAGPSGAYRRGVGSRHMLLCSVRSGTLVQYVLSRGIMLAVVTLFYATVRCLALLSVAVRAVRCMLYKSLFIICIKKMTFYLFL